MDNTMRMAAPAVDCAVPVAGAVIGTGFSTFARSRGERALSSLQSAYPTTPATFGPSTDVLTGPARGTPV